MTEPKSRSVSLAADKARQLRVQRLGMALDKPLDNPIIILDWLLAEIADNDPQTELWEKLHANAMRDGREKDVADAYTRTVNGPRMKRLDRAQQAAVIMHAVDYVSGVMGDAEGAAVLLERVLALVPTHEDAFGRLEKRLEKMMDIRRLVELYARVADTPPRAAQVLATQALHKLVTVPAGEVVSDEACRKLVALVPASPKLLDAIDAHCRATKRAALGAEVIEGALLVDEGAPAEITKARRHRLLELYTGDAPNAGRAVEQVEKLLERDANDAVAWKGAEKLMALREVSSRAAAALSAARRARQGGG